MPIVQVTRCPFAHDHVCDSTLNTMSVANDIAAVYVDRQAAKLQL